MSEEMVKGITVGEFNETLSLLPGQDNLVYHGEELEKWFRTLAEKHSRKVLEDFINDHFPESSLRYRPLANSTATYEYGVMWPQEEGSTVRLANKEDVERWKKEEYGRVYSDLEQDGDKVSSAKTEVPRETECEAYAKARLEEFINDHFPENSLKTMRLA